MTHERHTVSSISDKDLAEAAEITARAFGRDNDEENLHDTEEHLSSADQIQLIRNSERLVAYAAYRRKLWQPSS